MAPKPETVETEVASHLGSKSILKLSGAWSDGTSALGSLCDRSTGPTILAGACAPLGVEQVRSRARPRNAKSFIAKSETRILETCAWNGVRSLSVVPSSNGVLLACSTRLSRRGVDVSEIHGGDIQRRSTLNSPASRQCSLSAASIQGTMPLWSTPFPGKWAPTMRMPDLPILR